MFHRQCPKCKGTGQDSLSPDLAAVWEAIKAMRIATNHDLRLLPQFKGVTAYAMGMRLIKLDKIGAVKRWRAFREHSGGSEYQYVARERSGR